MAAIKAHLDARRPTSSQHQTGGTTSVLVMHTPGMATTVSSGRWELSVTSDEDMQGA